MAPPLPLGIPPPPAADPVAQMNTFCSYVTMLADQSAKDEIKLKAAQELNENFEIIINSTQYSQFLEHSIKIFRKILQEGDPHFISEYNIQQVRKLILEMIHRLPTNEHLRPYVKSILSLMLKLLEVENEENVLVCLRIIIEMHKQYRPAFNPDIQRFMQFVKGVYHDLPSHLNSIFEPREEIHVTDLSEINVEEILNETYTITQIHVEKLNPDGTRSTTSQTFNILPKAVLSLKVLQELPIVVVLLYQLYKPNVQLDITDFIPLIMSTITLQPSIQHRNSPNFNKEVFVDFMGAQIKTLSFLAYIIKLYQDVVAAHSGNMVKGMLGLLTLCPNEVAHLRKELLIAARHILATELRTKFVSHMDSLFDEDVLLGTGYTTHESLRPLAYSTLADLVHHVRTSLPAKDLARAVQLFSKNVHDDSLPTTIQTMSCKLLLNLVDCIRHQADSENNEQGRELLMRMLEVFVLKFKTISKLQLPFIPSRNHPQPPMTGFISLPYLHNPLIPLAEQIPPPQTVTMNILRNKSVSQPGTPLIKSLQDGFEMDTNSPSISKISSQSVPDSPSPNMTPNSQSSTGAKSDDLEQKDQEKSKFGFPSSQSVNINIADFRSLIKTLVCGVKTITWGCASCKPSPVAAQPDGSPQPKQFHPKETLVFINLVKWALKALDLYTLSRVPMNSMGSAQRAMSLAVRSKEEKEVLEHFSGVFSMMHPQTFQEIFTTTIEHMVEQIYLNPELQLIANFFLTNQTTSPIFATVLVEYLLERMEEMGSNVERSNLYLRLFKFVFGSVTKFPAENEHMLRPHLHRIVNMSMELAMTAKEPYNYFLLLRALFRSIGGGSHDLLYQEFLPLLPSLLEGLNRLQSGLHKQHMKDLFVELCLTVPVRLSSLLPYLPMLMDPLVSALNGSHTLISQGLRTLELCVDNLQPDFLYEHIQPVRAELMQALWRTLRNSDNVAHVAFRVLGKFGGGNRKMMIEPQRLEYNDKDVAPPAVIAYFQEHKKPIEFSVHKVIEVSFTALKSSTTDSSYRKQCWEVIRCYLSASLNLGDDKHTLLKLFLHPSFKEGKISPLTNSVYKSFDVQARTTHQTALTGMFVAAAIKELRNAVLTTLICVVRHYTMVAVAQQSGPFPLHQKPTHANGLDPLVLIDALAIIMGHEEKELCKPGHVALNFILQTATKILGSAERACRLPLMEYLSEKMTSLCYERAWYSKLGGCIAIKFFVDNMSPQWVFEHMFVFLKAFMFVMMDLTNEVSSGAIDMAKTNLENMLRVCACNLNDDVEPSVRAAQAKAMHDVIHELVRQVTSPHTIVRDQSMQSLKLVAELQNKTVTRVMEPHREILIDMIPPKKHLLRHQPANAQIGLMDGTTFCTTLEPRLFTIDLSVVEHKVFFHDLLSLCEADDAVLNKLACYKAVPNLVPLRKSALRALAACHYIQTGCREKIFAILYKALEKSNFELQQEGYECMQIFIDGFAIEKEIVHKIMRPFLSTLGDYRELSVNAARRLSYLTRLFPSSFNEKLCEQLLQHAKKLFEISIQQNTGGNFLAVAKTGDIEQKLVTILGIFHQVPATTPRYLELLCRLVLQTENHLQFEPTSPYREPLIRFLLRYPVETMEFLITPNCMKYRQWSRFVFYILKHIDGEPFRETLQNKVSEQIIPLVVAMSKVSTSEHPVNDLSEMQHVAMRIIVILMKFDDKWLSEQTELISAIRSIWNSDEYQSRMDGLKEGTFDFVHWKEPKLIVKILLKYFCYHPDDIDLLFQLLRVMVVRFIPDFQFLRDFLENIVAVLYDYNWKRAAFFRFVEHFCNKTISQDLTARVLQMILIPCFAHSFETGETQLLIGSAPMPYEDNSNNIVSVFIEKIIDPEDPYGCSDGVRIALLQFACLLVEQASAHIHDATNKRQGNKLRRLMTFAWPCLFAKNCVDPSTRYHGHLLLSHIIAKFAIHKRIVLQVFRSLLKAHAVEARTVVKQALEILTPAMPVRMEDGNTMFADWTKKIIVEEGHSMPQLFHILQLIVRHYKVYYPVRHHLVQHMVGSIQRLGFSPTASLEHRKLAVELSEVIVKWDLQRIREENDEADQLNTITATGATKRGAAESATEVLKKMAIENPSGSNIACPVQMKMEPGSNRPIDQVHTDAVLNFLMRLACQVNDPNCPPSPVTSPGELLARRCVGLIKMALKPDVWPQQCDLKIAWFDKIFTSIELPNSNLGNVCTGIELITYLMTVLKKEIILQICKPLQRGLAACIVSLDPKLIKLMHQLLTKLMSLYPPEPTSSNLASKYEELDSIYACVAKTVFDGLSAYEKNPAATSSSLFGTFMLLKAACVNTPSYIDRLITPFMRVLHRMSKEHLNAPATTDANTLGSELLIIGLELVKTRVVVMGVEMRKVFIGNVLVSLIEKTPDIKVMKAITKMLEEWMKHKNPITLSQAPSLREKSILLVKMMQYVEKRFPDDTELNGDFLELVNYVYRDEQLKTSELPSKLEPAFLAGLRCNQPELRAKFFEVFDGSMRRRLHDRLLYIICSQNWDSMGPHYWIKQCIELLIVTCVSTKQIQMANEQNLLPSVASVINLADSEEKKHFIIYTSNVPKEDPTSDGIDIMDFDKEEIIELETSDQNKNDLPKEEQPKISSNLSLPQIVSAQSEFLENARKVRTEQILVATAQLCHMDTSLAESVWLDFFPKLWSILDESQHNALISEMIPFVCSGTHVVQKDCHPSALATFVEALSHCNPPVALKPGLMKYLGKSHNLWHRMTIALEQMALDAPTNTKLKQETVDCYDFEPDSSPQTEIISSLGDMYSLLCEEDMWSGLWQKHAHYKETNIAIAFEQQGFFEEAQGAYDLAMTKHKQDCSLGPASFNTQRESLLWENHWIRCAKELNQWDLLLDYAISKGERNHFLILESAWRVPNWELMKEALSHVEYSCSKEMQWRVNMYRGFLAICHPKEQRLKTVDRYTEMCSGLCMREWRRLPHLVSHIHLPLLQAAQQIMELQEASHIHQGLIGDGTLNPHDMKAIVKTWRNRLPVIADDLSHWSDIFTWRQHHYQFIANHYDTKENNQHNPNPGMLGVHASAQAIIHFGKIARKQNLTGVCLESLSRIYTIPSVPIVDCFQKIRQQVKCYLQMASFTGIAELQEGLEVIESTNLKYFTKEMTSEFYALKGMLLSHLGRSDEANKAFSAACLLHDTLVKAWALWGDYLENIFTKEARNVNIGVSAITCFLHACRHQNESKSRKYLAKVLWMMTYDDDKGTIMEAVDKYAVGVPPVQWLPWIPQLLVCLVQYEGNVVLNLLSQVGRMFPQAVYFPIRTLYLTLKIEQRERYKNVEIAIALAGKFSATQAVKNQSPTVGTSTPATNAHGIVPPTPTVQVANNTAPGLNPGPLAVASFSAAVLSRANTNAQNAASASASSSGTEGPIRATPSMWRCSKIMQMQRDIHPTVLSSLEGIVDQMVWFRENWYEEVLRQLRQGLVKCYAIAYEYRGGVNEATITPHTVNFVKKLVSTFGIGIENISSSVNASFPSAASESLARRAQATVQDPVFQKMKGQFRSDFDFSQPGSMRLHSLIIKLKKWIKILEAKTKLLPKSFLIEEKCRFLSNFSLKTAEVELPGEFLLPRHSHYCVRIARFMPRVEIVQKHNTAARRLYIRGHNGKIYPYLVVNDSGLADARREERVLQLLRMLNHYFGKQKETSRRFLNFTIPKVVAVSPQMRLVEDNPASISLLDIYKKGCNNIGLEHDTPIARYYERLASVQCRGVQASHQVLRDILREVQSTMVPRTMLKSWALKTFPSATDYWTFRKVFTLQLALSCFAEYVLHLTRLNPDMMYIHQDSGLVNIAYFKFDIDDLTLQFADELDSNRPVPFRLTPNIVEYLSHIGISGPLTACTIAAARCLVHPTFKVPTILRTILRDEMYASHKKREDKSAENLLNKSDKNPKLDPDKLINHTTRAVTAVMNRLNTLSLFDGVESKVATLVAAANSHDNLCRMDPAWHPWL